MNKFEKQAKEVLGLTEGSKVHQAASLYLRAAGATTADVMKATGSGPQLNILSKVQMQGHGVEKQKRKVDGQTVYRIKLATRGSAKGKATRGSAKGKTAKRK